MKIGCIYSVEITTNSNEIISVSSDDFDHFYIANINDEGDEQKYYKNNNKTLVANFFMLRVLNGNNNITSQINRLLNKNDIIKIKVLFTNGNSQEFDIPKKRVVQNKQLVNLFEETFTDDFGLCILITDKKIKYKENLFA